MTRAEFDQMMERNFKNFSVPKDNFGGILLWIPEYKEFLSMHFGDGTNTDELEDGCEDYIYYEQLDPEYDCDDSIELEENDGGQMDIPNAAVYDDTISHAIPDLLFFVYDRFTEVVPIKVY